VNGKVPVLGFGFHLLAWQRSGESTEYEEHGRSYSLVFLAVVALMFVWNCTTGGSSVFYGTTGSQPLTIPATLRRPLNHQFAYEGDYQVSLIISLMVFFVGSICGGRLHTL
jgi:hypothetical protein